ncbi:MAG TPA: hypothetical protein VHG91_14470 [Longimicrobium sp.]|nr:hypothetical protein [Longimicrobium sp.]
MKRSLAAPLVLALAALAACENDPAGPDIPEGCTAYADLAVGEAATFEGAEAVTVCLDNGGDGAEYALVGFRATRTTDKAPFQVDATDVDNVLGPPNPSLNPGAAPLLARLGSFGATPDRDFHVRLRERAAKELNPLVRSLDHARRAGGPRLAVSPAPPVVGQILPLNVSLSACTTQRVRFGRVKAISNRAIVVEDTTNPKNGLTDAEFQSIAVTFDTLVAPINDANFGAPADIDANQRVVIFYTRAVNEMTERGSSSYVGGFFYARDLFPKTATEGFDACAGSNEAEMFYMLAADPTGVVNGNIRSRELILRNTIATVGHEYQHLINASRRLFVLDVRTDDWNEVVWLNEGLSHIAEELLFYRASGLSPRQNIGADDMSSQRRVDAFNQYALDNFLRLEEYLQHPDTTSPYETDDDLAIRGSIWSFLRYAADRKGGSEPTLWNQLVNNDVSGFENLEERLGVDPVDWVHDWTVANYTDDAVSTTGSTYRHASWDYRSIFGALSTPSRYPLLVRELTNANTLSLTVRGGAGTYLRAAVESDDDFGRVEFDTNGASVPDEFRVTVVRTK